MQCSLLLVDDDVEDRDIFLDAVRIDFSCKPNGREALEYLKSSANLPDFIFLDPDMPYYERMGLH
jgi:CheY-like chemotaxis protein